MTAGEALRAAPIDRLDAEVLLAHLLGIPRLDLLLDLDRPVPAAFAALVERRAKGEPVAYIIGRREFWSLDIDVAPGVLIPRPDSETLIEAAIAHFDDRAPRTILDLGTGSGALLLAALTVWPEAAGIGIDTSSAALEIARTNACRLGIPATVQLGDWSGTGTPHDLILCNPPYIAEGAELPRDIADWEPHAALFAGPDGLDDYRRLAPLIGAQLAEGGVACIEVGHDKAELVSVLFRTEKLRVDARRDLGGHQRCLIVTK